MHAKHRIFLFLSLLLIVAAAALLFSGGKKQETKEEPGRKHIAFSSVLPANPEKKEAEEDEAWALILVNAEHPIPEDYTVTLTLLRNGQAVDRRAYPDLQEMVDDMRAQGLSPLICSSYRTQEKQQKLYDAQVQKYLDKGYSREAAEEEASKWSAYPGTSEHQTGLALDIVSTAYQVLDEKAGIDAGAGVAFGKQLEIRLHSAVPAGEKRDHRDFLRAVALPLCRKSRGKGDL